MKERTYIAIDLKSFYASVECVDRGLDPLDTNLVVADKSRTEKTICLAVTPALKSYGVSGRARLFEVVQKVRELNRERRRNAPNRKFTGKSHFDSELKADPSLELGYIVAPPRMSHYIEYSTKIYQIYLQYAAPEDIHVYSIDEVFIDVTSYLKTAKCTAREYAMRMIKHVLKETGITATAGNVAFDVCYANGSYKDGVSVTVNTTGTITGIIELGTWNAAGGSNPAPDINDYLEKANLTINNVKLEGEIINKVGGFNDYEPDNAGGTDEENKAEYNEKLQKAIDINGGTFAAGSKVENYLPEGGYKTDAAGNIIVGKKNDSNRITGCVYLNEDYHALIVNGRFIAQPHVDNGTGFCVACKGVIVADTAE